MHHDFGPRPTPANGYQFTLIGNAVDGTTEVGHHGPRQPLRPHPGQRRLPHKRRRDRHRRRHRELQPVRAQFRRSRSEGSGDAAPRSGYGGPTPDPGGEGAGFWFRGPNNYIRHNVAASADAFGFGVAAGSMDVIAVPAFKGADTGVPRETVALDPTAAGVLDFSDNEAYGAMKAGVAWGWNGTIRRLRVWHTSRHGLAAMPPDSLVIEQPTIRGDPSILTSQTENSAGIWLGDYRAKTIVVRDADVQGMRTGITSPFYQGFKALEPGRGDGSLLIEHGYFRDYVGVSIATAYRGSVESGAAPKRAVVRDSVFEPLAVPIDPWNPPATISMNHQMAPNDPSRAIRSPSTTTTPRPATTSRFTTRSKRRLTSHRATTRGRRLAVGSVDRHLSNSYRCRGGDPSVPGSAVLGAGFPVPRFLVQAVAEPRIALHRRRYQRVA